MSYHYDSLMAYLTKELKEMGNDLTMHAYVAIIRTAYQMLYSINTNFKRYGLNQTTITILHYLIISGGTLTPTQLSIKTGRSKQTITPAIDNLAKKGLIKRDEIEGDRRIRAVSITEDGLKLVHETWSKSRDMYFNFMSSLDDNSLEKITADMKTIKKNIDRQMNVSKKKVKI